MFNIHHFACKYARVHCHFIGWLADVARLMQTCQRIYAVQHRCSIVLVVALPLRCCANANTAPSGGWPALLNHSKKMIDRRPLLYRKLILIQRKPYRFCLAPSFHYAKKEKKKERKKKFKTENHWQLPRSVLTLGNGYNTRRKSKNWNCSPRSIGLFLPDPTRIVPAPIKNT